ncbi:MAG TPA: fibronectin type III domain-containing protein, partial [Candidatus Saccharimonadales bacterium]
DISVKATSNWKLALSWEPPSDTGAGVSTYKIYRSTNNSNFINVASTAGTSYVDSGLSQKTYYYKVQACDSANNCGALTSVVNFLPTGKFTTPANLISGPSTATTTRTADISWATDRGSDSSVEYGLTPGHYFTTEAATSNQVTSHTISLNSLSAGTTYYYRAQWTDVDGNQGTSAEGAFTTLPAPTVSNVTTGNINLSSATIQFTSSNATAVQLQYGGGALSSTQTLNTSTNTSTYSIPLHGLSPGTTYTFKLNPYDTSGNVYDNPTAFSFTTPPQPVISNVQFQPVPGALTGTEQISWTTNVPATSQISYGLLNGTHQNQLDTAMTTDHSMTISDLSYNTQYSVTATSVDTLGNSANSDQQVFKSGVDTRPPRVSDVTIQPSIVGNGASAKGQLVVSWKTDKPGTSQVTYGQGTSGDYSTKTAENSALVNSHTVVVSGLSTSQVYHIQVISNDSEGIKGVSGDQTTIIGQASDNALSIVFNALQSIFGL